MCEPEKRAAIAGENASRILIWRSGVQNEKKRREKRGIMEMNRGGFASEREFLFRAALALALYWIVGAFSAGHARTRAEFLKGFRAILPPWFVLAVPWDFTRRGFGGGA